MQWLSSPLDRLRHGAQELAAWEWPIAPAHYVSTPGRHRRHGRHRPAGEVCSCRDVRCGRPGAHPLSTGWRVDATIDPFTIGCWWYGPQPWNILLPTGLMFDVWSAPFDVASRALEILRSSGCPIGPVAHSPNGEWLFFTEARPAEPPIELPHTVAVGYHGAGDYVLAPPSLLAGAQVRWWRPPAPDNPRLPRWEPVAEAMLRAARHGPPAAPETPATPGMVSGPETVSEPETVSGPAPVVPIRRAG